MTPTDLVTPADLMAEHGSPLWLVDLHRVRERLRTFRATCDADLGDQRCTIELASADWTASALVLDSDGSERIFAAVATTPEDALDAVLHEMHDDTEVHRVVLPYRAWRRQQLFEQGQQFVERLDAEALDAVAAQVGQLACSLVGRHALGTTEESGRLG